MSANRKLQTEVDRVLKKVEEGVEIFDDIWGKVYSAPQQSLKEKYEADLKKEIKKLQRLRDQIKTWISSGDIKDKSALMEARRLIEIKMEEFKICEKETKTKAFSKEGLAREEKLNPREIEREEKRAFIQTVVERIEGVVESIEADLEKLSNTKAKGKLKEQMDKLEARIVTNRWHISKLELIHRLLDNDSLEPSKLDGIKEEIEYYLELIDTDDAIVGMETEEYNIYEELQLDALSLGGPNFANKSEEDEENESEEKGDGEQASAAEPPIEEIPAPIPLVASISSGAKPKKVATVPQSLVAPPNPTLAATTSTTSANTASGTAAAPSAAPSKLSSVISSVGTKSAAAVVAGTPSKAVPTPTTATPAAGSKVVPGQKSAPTAAAIVAGNIPSSTQPTTAASAAAAAPKAPALTAAKIVSGEKKTTPPVKSDTRKDPSGPAPVVAATPLAGSWAHAATSSQRISSASSTVSPQPNTTPKQPSLVPQSMPPVENLPQATLSSSESSNSDSKLKETVSQQTSTPSTTAPSSTTSSSGVASTATSSSTSTATNTATATAKSIESEVATAKSIPANTTATPSTTAPSSATAAAAVVPTLPSVPEVHPPVAAKSAQSPVLTAASNPSLATSAPEIPAIPALVDESPKSSIAATAPSSHRVVPSQTQPAPQLPPSHQPQTQSQQPAQQPTVAMSSPGPSQGLPPPHRPSASASGSGSGSGSQELQALAHMLKMSMTHIPPTDASTDRTKPYTPRAPFPGQLHPSFPTTPHPIIENPALFERLPMDTLFLSFYYQQGSYQQYLAAKQLKKHSWRFHKKYMTWFQRHEEPKTTTNDYEEGTYVYFDYESGWCQRIKSEFKFEYAYLEDELASNPSTSQQQQQQQQQHASTSNS